MGLCDRIKERVCAKKRKKVQVFMEDQLQKGYIQPSKLPQTLPVYFVAKRDSKKRMVQDYYYMNQ